MNSVVAMSVYKNDSFAALKAAIESVIGQSEPLCRFCIVIDGEVSNETVEYMDSIRSHFSCILINEVNKGLAFSMNRVIEHVIEEGWNDIKYFFRMDADDVSVPGRFEKQIAYMEEHHLDVVGSNCIEINAEGEKIGVRCMPERHKDIISIMPRRCVINHPTVLIRFELFRAGFRYNPELMNTQDYYLWADLLAAGYRFGNIQEPLLYFRRDADFISRRGRKKAFNDLRARFNMMRKLNKYSVGNVLYALSFFCARMMPESILRFLYKLNERINHSSGERNV